MSSSRARNTRSGDYQHRLLSLFYPVEKYVRCGYKISMLSLRIGDETSCEGV